ncbi:sensor histidine kinase [Marmoricola sp. RAF53]|uniref:sensor histidine kinase n=1 Tax=Marmoricola sp. RAF53 TaxID=3233059 RepID=UPI003F984781
MFALTTDGHYVPSVSQVDAGSLQRLVRAIRDLAAARDVADIVEIVRHAARELVGADGATFVLRDGDQCYYVDEDAIEPLWAGMRFPLESCISGWAMNHHQAVFLPDIYVDDRIPHAAYRPTFVKSLAMTPVRTTDPVAAIGTYWADEHVTTPAEAEVLQALADSTAVALERAQVLHHLEEVVAERTQEIAASNADLAAFAQVVAHDLKTPLTTIALYAEMVATLDGPVLSEEGAGALETMGQMIVRMGGLVDAVLSYSTAATEVTTSGKADFNVLARQLLEDLDGLVQERHALVEVDDLPVAHGSPALLARVLQNLVQNAIQYGDPEKPVVRVSGRTSRTSVSITVSDNGPGVAPEERSRIFDMLARGSAAAGSAGSGIGLAFARRVAARHGGTLTVDDGPDGGARFTLTLPRRESADDLASYIER